MTATDYLDPSAHGRERGRALRREVRCASLAEVHSPRERDPVAIITERNVTHDTPAESSTFRQVRLPPEVAFSWGDRHFQDPIANHIRIAEGPETNQEALLDLRNRLIP